MAIRFSVDSAQEIIEKIVFLKGYSRTPGYLTARYIRSVEGNRASTTVLTPRTNLKTHKRQFDSIWANAGGIILLESINCVCDTLEEANEVLAQRRHYAMVEHETGDCNPETLGAAFSDEILEELSGSVSEPADAELLPKEVVAWMHPNGAIWRVDNCPEDLDFTRDGWIALVRAD